MSTAKGIFSFLDVMMCCHMFTFCDTTLTDWFKEAYDLRPEIVSMLYAVQSISFLTLCLVPPKLVTKMSAVLLIVLAQYEQAFAAFLIGPSEALRIPCKLWITMVGFTISGFGSPFTIIPAYKELENSLQVYEGKYNFNPEEVQDVVSGLFNSAYAMGGITGPLFGGMLTLATDFRVTADIQGLILLAIASLQLLIVYIPEKVKARRKTETILSFMT